MAFKSRNLSADGKRVMTVDEFKSWLMRFDNNGDHRISRDELTRAIRAVGGHRWSARWKSKRGLRSADVDGDGFLGENEIKNLANFAEKYFNIKVYNM